MAFGGNYITGNLGYGFKNIFLGNAINSYQIQTFDFDISSVDFTTLQANVIWANVNAQFVNNYSGEVTTKLFNTENSFVYPSDSIRATKFHAQVELKNPISNLNVQQPELTNGGYYSGLDGNFFGTYGNFLLEFREGFSFSTNDNGNRAFNHDISFGLQTGWTGDNTTNGRKSFAQTIASGIFAQDDNLVFGLVTMVGQISGLANPALYRNYYSESYDLFKNTYSFARRREELPFDGANDVYNLNYTVNMAENGTVEVSEKASTVGNIDFGMTKAGLEAFISGSYGRCLGKYNQFYNTGIILEDAQYGTNYPSLLALINTPVKTVRNYNANSLEANFETTFTNNPEFSGDGTITAQNIEFNIGEYNQVEATHSFDYTVNRIVQNSGYSITGLIANTTGQSPSTMFTYYTGNYGGIYSIFPNFNMIKSTATWPNIKTKSSVKFSYSNNPTYFFTTNGVTFNILDYSIDNKNVNDIIVEYKIVNPPGNQSIMSYQYQSENGEIGIKMKALLGKNSSQFYPDSVGNFADLNNILAGNQPLSYYLQALYQFGGQIFLQQFNFPIEALNWFLKNSQYSLDSESNLSVDLSYAYTWKKRNYSNFN